MSLLVLLSIAVLPSPINDYVEFKGGGDRASVKILQSSTRTARDRVIEEEISKAALVGPGKDSAGSVVGSRMNYRAFDYTNGRYITIYYSDTKSGSSTLACEIRGESTRYSAFINALKYCARVLGLVEPSVPINPPANDEGGSLLWARDHSVPPRPIP